MDGVKLPFTVRDDFSVVRLTEVKHNLPVDDELGNWWTSANPASHFTFTLIATRSPHGRRQALRNLEYTIHVPGQESERRRLTPQQVCTVLEQDFGITVPDQDRVIERLRAMG